MTVHKIITATLFSLTLISTAHAESIISSILAIEPIPTTSNINQAQAELGKKLFFEPRLSKSGMISCTSCHNLSMGGSNGLETFVSPNGAKGNVNVPTILNVSLNDSQHWDGAMESLEQQARRSLKSTDKMGTSHALSTKVLQSIPEYAQAFKQIFNTDTIAIEHITQSIAEFERTLLTPNSRFDQWLMGKKDALTAQELSGYELFTKSDCTTCHSGIGIGGNLYEEIGLFDDVEGKDELQTFKVPTLRNIALTAPYFHDGKVKTLAKAVRKMGRLQVGENFTQQEVEQLVAFLKTLTGEQPSFSLPSLPPSTDQTPRPQM